jgi:hypothetical protein
MYKIRNLIGIERGREEEIEVREGGEKWGLTDKLNCHCYCNASLESHMATRTTWGSPYIYIS